MTTFPESIRLHGTGVFTVGSSEIHAPFTIIWDCQYVWVISTAFPGMADLPLGKDTWSLRGELDDGRKLKADNLILAHARIGTSQSRAEFHLPEGILIGTSSRERPVRIRYRLVCLYRGKASFTSEGWKASLSSDLHDPERTARLAGARQIPLEGLSLILSHEDATIAQHHSKARDIAALLSLASGNGVTAHRVTIEWAEHEPQHVWRHQSGAHIGPGPVIPSTDYGSFLAAVLPEWTSWRRDKQARLRLALDYVNLSAAGYLDVRVFQVMQAWEFVANAWGAEGALSQAEQTLKSGISRAYRRWRKNNKQADPDGRWGSRLLFAFKWPQARDSILQLAADRGLDLRGLGVDLDRLKAGRDSVAHTGRLPEKLRSENRETLDLLFRTQNALQLLLVAELGYEGRVYRRSLDEREVIVAKEVFGAGQ
jgi:hypothetical protein